MGDREHDHVFGQDQPVAAEGRTLVVVALTAITMVVEIAAGLLFGSMALLADGLHMASHAAALGIAAFAYRYARRHAADRRYSFGTGKVNALAGYSGAVLLCVFALGMAGESVERFVHPVEIAVDQALLVAVLGLLVNGASAAILGRRGHGRSGHEHHHDHNLRAAYLHVIADALTSVLAIAALLAAKHLGWTWLDPAMGIVGAVLVVSWSLGLLRGSSRVLLDRQAGEADLAAVRAAVEADPGTRVVDLHVWTIGPGRRAAILCIEAEAPRDADAYRALLPSDLGLEHVTVEIDRPG